jgi:hypothetical protein
MKTFKPAAALLLIGAIGCSSPTPQETILLKAQELVHMLKAVYTDQPAIEPARLEDFNLLDMGYYQQTRATLQPFGFQPLGDLEFKHLTRYDLSLKTCIQTYRSGEGTTSAGVWHVHPGPKMPKDVKVIELESEFSDGYWITTRNNATSHMKPDPAHVTETIAPDASLAELIQKHREAVQRYASTHPSANLVTFSSLADVISSQTRQAIQEAAYRKKIGGVTESELQAAAPQWSKKDIRSLLAEIRRLY